MKRDRSNQSSSASRPLGLPKESILRGRKDFQRLFDDQLAVTYFRSHIKIRFCTFGSEQDNCKMGFIIPTKLGKAVRRNRVKRLLRESYRLNQYMLKDVLNTYNAGFHGVLMSKSINIDFETAETEVVDLLEKVQAYMHSTFKV